MQYIPFSFMLFGSNLLCMDLGVFFIINCVSKMIGPSNQQLLLAQLATYMPRRDTICLCIWFRRTHSSQYAFHNDFVLHRIVGFPLLSRRALKCTKSHLAALSGCRFGALHSGHTFVSLFLFSTDIYVRKW